MRSINQDEKPYMDNTALKTSATLPSLWRPLLVTLIICVIAASFFMSQLPIFPNIPDHTVELLISSCITVSALIIVFLIQFGRRHRAELITMTANFEKELSERLQTEANQQQLEKALLQGQKLQAIGTLAGGIAHDFNNLLYAIMGYAEMAQQDSAPDTTLYKNLGKVLTAARRGQDLVARILAFSRRQHQDLKPIHLGEAIEGAMALLKPTIPASVIIHYKPIADDYTILGNQTQLHQVIVNLITNAVDAMDGEGDITVQLDRIGASSPEAHGFSKLNDATHYYKISLMDTGHGMDAATRERIFEPFFTTKEVGRGTGLGLSTVHSIVKEHMGEITVNSTPGSGATFTLYLPEYMENTDGKHSAG